MSHIHAIVWLDHLEATVIGFSLGRSEVVEIHSQSPHRQIHRKSGIPGSGHAADDLDFFADVVAALRDMREVLITGPGTAKVAFEKYVQDRHPDVAQRIVGVETLDHPSDGELVAYARKYFKRVDQLGPRRRPRRRSSCGPGGSAAARAEPARELAESRTSPSSVTVADRAIANQFLHSAILPAGVTRRGRGPTPGGMRSASPPSLRDRR